MSGREPTQDEIDDEPVDDDDVEDGWEECGRWDNGRLTMQCSKAGSEECDWHCPIGLPVRKRRKRAMPLLDIMGRDDG